MSNIASRQPGRPKRFAPLLDACATCARLRLYRRRACPRRRRSASAGCRRYRRLATYQAARMRRLKLILAWRIEVMHTVVSPACAEGVAVALLRYIMARARQRLAQLSLEQTDPAFERHTACTSRFGFGLLFPPIRRAAGSPGWRLPQPKARTVLMHSCMRQNEIDETKTTEHDVPPLVPDRAVACRAGSRPMYPGIHSEAERARPAPDRRASRSRLVRRRVAVPLRVPQVPAVAIW